MLNEESIDSLYKEFEYLYGLFADPSFLKHHLLCVHLWKQFLTILVSKNFFLETQLI